MLFCFGSKPEPDGDYGMIPRSLRYRLRFGRKKTEVHEHSTIIRLGGKRILKKDPQSTEYEALRVVDRHTSVPVPKVIGVYDLPDELLVELECVTGRTLDLVWNELSQQQRKKVVDDLGRFVDQLRKMKPPIHEIVGSATMGACFDQRFGREGRFGPFYTLDSFHEFIRRGHPIEDFSEDELRRTHRRAKPYELKFTHADLTPQNILVDENGRVSSILDWESAGWYPEYWEYTQMHFATPKNMSDWLQAMERVMTKYDDELVAEEALRKRYSSADYDCAWSFRRPSITPSELRKEKKEINDKNTESTSG